MWTVYVKYLQWTVFYLRLCLKDVSYKVLNYGQLMQMHKSNLPWNYKTYILNPRAPNGNISPFVGFPQETEELFLKLSWLYFPDGKKKMSLYARDLCSQRNTFSDCCFLTSCCLKLCYCMIFAYGLVCLLVFISNRPCYLLMILWPRKILNQPFHHCQTTYLKMKKLWGLSA